MKLNKFFANKNSAQAMVEFALALPVLLLLLYGVLEAGRLLALYSTVVTASRQAVRYGAATGENAAGTPRYNDCDGIKAAANRVAFLSGGAFAEIKLYWDKGPGTPETEYCTDPVGTPGNLSENDLVGNSTRLRVWVREPFVPLVKLVPFPAREIIGDSKRTILFSVPIVVDLEEVDYYQEKTITEIIADTPDSSAPNQAVTVTVNVKSDPTNPTTTMPDGGQVIITAAPGVVDVSNCGGLTGIDLVNGTITCTVIFASSGNYVLNATYTGDDTHLPSSDVENHTVGAVPTITTITFIIPNPVVKNQNVSFTVNVTGGTSAPTGTVEIDGGSGNAKCTITLTNGAGTCTIVGGYNNNGIKTVTATYSGDAGHLTSKDTDTVEVLDATPTPTNTPSPTITPTATLSPTTTLSPTATLIPSLTPTITLTPTILPNCNAITVTHGKLTRAGTMTMSITNGTGANLLVSNVFVAWNNDKGHQTGSDKSLKLLTATLGATNFFNGNLYASSTTITPGNLFIPTGTSTMTFIFHQSYDSPENSDRLVISLASNGCTGVVIDSNK